jgi:phage tail-like protein
MPKTRRAQEPKSYFKVIIEGVEVVRFLKISNLSTFVEVDEELDERRKIVVKNPGTSGCENVILSKGRTRDQPFWNWLEDIQSGRVEKKTLAIELVYKNKPLRGWKLINCWPCRWSISDITDDVLDTIEEVELVVEKIELL